MCKYKKYTAYKKEKKPTVNNDALHPTTMILTRWYTSRLGLPDFFKILTASKTLMKKNQLIFILTIENKQLFVDIHLLLAPITHQTSI